MCELNRYDLGPALLNDENGRTRVVLRGPSYTELLELAVAQPRRYGAADPAVMSRIITMLREIAWTTTDPQRHAAVIDQLKRALHTINNQQLDTDECEGLGNQAELVRQALSRKWPRESGP